MNATERLTNDHNKVRGLFRKFNGGGGITGMVRRTMGTVSAQERRSAVQQVCKQLEMHTRIEEEIFYPAVQALNDPELNRQVKEALAEHAKVKREVSRLRGAQGARDDLQDDLDEQMGQLEEDVEHHASEEEREMFPRVEELMTDQKELVRRMQALKRGGQRAAPGKSVGQPTRSRAKTSQAGGRGSVTTRKRGGVSKGTAASKHKRSSVPKRTVARRKRGKAGSVRR